MPLTTLAFLQTAKNGGGGMTIFVTRTFVRSEVINAGRQLFFCIHKFFPLKQLVMNERMLSVPSDRGCQTCRSENVQTATGILFPTAVRPAPQNGLLCFVCTEN